MNESNQTRYVPFGCFERHAIRRHMNPLFPLERRVVPPGELDDARRRDAEESGRLDEDIVALKDELDSWPDVISWGTLAQFRERVEELQERVPQLGGARVAMASQVLDGIRDAVLRTAYKAFGGDAEKIAALEEADFGYRKAAKLYGSELIAQILRKDGPIRPEEVIPTILSEPVEEIRSVLQTHSEFTMQIQQGARMLVDELEAELKKVSAIRSKLIALLGAAEE